MVRGNKSPELVSAADRLVHQRGFERTTLAEIAGAAGVPAGNVYYYFKTKEQLGQRLIEERARRYRLLREAWDAEADPKARLRRFVQMTIDNREQLAESGCPIGSLCQELHKTGGPLASQASSLFGEFLDWLEAQFRALGQGRRSRALAVHLLSALQGASLLAHSLGDPTIVAAEARRLQQWVGAL